ncbi:hypothetical protein HPG69_019015 [Diceros bicornis minor]|uniref:G-protein coupled receptors family 3 profile domain-containing protein n=1 Tax=Diceros bicornis minor TaxID=77932 RepID=A0A7J7FH63_DICBM|nr:hypothetical protein HPG69_019015 [Diceros bicornis minor]
MQVIWISGFHQSARDGAQNCTGPENMTAVYPSAFKLPDLTATYPAYLAAKALLATYHNLMSCSSGEGPFLGGTCTNAQNSRPWQVLHYAQKVHFTTRAQTEIFFTDDGEMLTMFNLENMYNLPDQRGQTAIVAHFDFRGPPGEELLISNMKMSCGDQEVNLISEVKLLLQLPSLPERRDCHDTSAAYEKCPEDKWPNMEKTPRHSVGVCTALLFLLTLAILGIFFWHHHTPIVRVNNLQLSYLLLSSSALCFLSPFTYVGHPGPFTRAVCQAAFGVTFTICVSTVLAKTIVVVAAFHATRPDTCFRKWAGPVLPSTIPIVSSLVQTNLCLLWVTRWSPGPVNSTEPGSTVTVKCDENSLELFYAMLVLGFARSGQLAGDLPCLPGA